MSIEALQKALEKEKAARQAAEAKVDLLSKELDHLKKVALPEVELQLAETNIMFSGLSANMQEGILVEDEEGRIKLINKVFCRQFGIDESMDTAPANIKVDYINQSKHLFNEPERYEERIREILKEKKAIFNEQLELKDGRIYSRDYIPAFSGNVYKAHLWKFIDVTATRALEQQLQNQRAFFQQILDGIPADIAVFNKDHRYLFVNPVAIRNPELREWIVGKNDEEYCRHMNRPLSIADGRRRLFKKVKDTNALAEWEEKIKRPDGNEEYHLRRMFPVTDKKGNLEMVIGFGMNITALKKMEENLQLSEKRYREIFSFSQAWICTHDMNGTILTINPAACKILGYAEQELIGIPIANLIPEKLQEQFYGTYLGKIRQEGRSEGVMNILDRDSKNIYLLYQNYVVAEPGTDPYVIGFAQNITERLQAEDALKRSEEKYRGIIENMNLGMLELDMNEQIVYANQRFCTMSGYSQQELISRKLRDLFLQGDNKRVVSEKVLQRQFGIANSYELAVQTKKGEEQWWLVSTAPLYNEDGAVRGSISIHLDISRQKKLEQQLREAKSDAERSSDSKDTFLTNMSHEIRTPINAIMGLGKLLAKSQLDEQQKYYLSSIRAASESLLVIINDILDLSKIEAGKISLEHMAFDLKKITTQAIAMLTHKAEEKGLILSCEVDPQIASRLTGDPFRISQVLVNMISNAIKFTEKGSVELKADLVKEVNDIQDILITIKDTGIGISEVFINDIFNKFTQEDETVARKFGGTGLGMSITKQLMELMGGKVNITSKKNEGTTIYLEFKFKIGSEKVLEKKRAINKSDTRNIEHKKILLVEDNDLNRLLAYTILKQYGAEVSTAENGEVAVAMVRDEQFDIVLMDVQMPVMDGITATKIIRAEISDTVPIIALTANAIKGKKEQYITAGMNDCITKPYDEDKMVTLISTWINKKVGETNFIPVAERKKVVQAATIADVAKEEPLYDVRKLEEISAGSDDFIIQMLRLFISDIPISVQKINAANETGDYNAIKYLAHRIRPSLQNMSVNSIRQDMLDIERLAEAGMPNPILDQLIRKITGVTDRVIELIKKQYSL